MASNVVVCIHIYTHTRRKSYVTVLGAASLLGCLDNDLYIINIILAKYRTIESLNDNPQFLSLTTSGFLVFNLFNRRKLV